MLEYILFNIQNQSIVNTINSDRSFYNDGFYFRLFLVFSSTKKSKEKGISVIINLVSQRLSKQTDGFALTKNNGKRNFIFKFIK